ncbi:MAG: patatin-like phospholipase family protein [Cyanobacteriota bacterium]|nr:patatin-like phospholipase family protein [Cyanobacteriota bacterium]
MDTPSKPNAILGRLRQPGPKKILACDGGGIRGLISLGILAKLEADLRYAFNEPGLLLGDYFDFICGTSTGGIIATCLSCGMAVDEVVRFYRDNGSSMFERAKWYLQLHEKYGAEPLAELLKKVLNCQLHGPGYIYHESDPAVELGDQRLKGLLMLVMRNHSTDSPWPVCNNPLAKYNQPELPDCNLRLPLWKLVRASTAAPTFFPPEVMTFAEGTEDAYQFLFVDGGITTYNNPAYLAFQMATAAPYHIQWPTGVEQMLIVSIGTGNAPSRRENVKADDLWLLDHAKSIPAALMNAATAGWDMVCRTLGECRFGGEIDSEFGAMLMPPGGSSDPATANWTGPKQFAYVRYDPLTTQEQLNELGLSEVSEASMQKMDDVKMINTLYQLGQTYATRYLDLSHLEGFVPAAALPLP